MLIAMAYRGFSEQDEEAVIANLHGPLEEKGHKLLTVPLNPKLDEKALEQTLQNEVSKLMPLSMWILGGFSLGARIAARLALQLKPSALLCLGYPFHHCRKPSEPLGLENFKNNDFIKTLVIQGEFDPFGSKKSLEKIWLPRSLEISWVENANHRFECKRQSKKASIASRCVEFVQTIEKDHNG